MKVVLYGAPVVSFATELPPRLNSRWDIIKVDDLTPADQVAAAFGAADAVIAVDFGADLPPAPNVRLVQVPGAGYDGIDLKALPPGAALCNVHRHEQGVAEFAILAMLQWNTRYLEAVQGFRTGSWERSSRFGAPPHAELSAKTIGIVGLGRIGQTLARYLQPFGARVIASEYHDIVKPAGVDELYPLSGLAAVAAQSDFLVICCALTEETRGLVDKSIFDAMPDTSVLVNIARGPLVDEDALYEAVTTRRIAGAVIDVWYRYPNTANARVSPSRHRFEELPNVYMTPHIAGWTNETVKRRWDFIAENLDRLAAGLAPEHVVYTQPKRPSSYLE